MTRVTIHLLATAAAAALLAVGAGAATAAATTTHTANSPKVIQIAMKDPGCHWFLVGGKYLKSLTVPGAATFRNTDEAALVFKGNGFTKRLAVGKTLRVAKAGVYHITMVGQAPDDNHLLLVVK